MGTAMTPAQIVSQLTRWNIKFKPYKQDWASHNRGQRGKGWGNVHGLIIHHVGSDGDAREDLYSGNTELPGPKCQFYIDTDGVLWLIGWGRANHAGGGDPDVLRHVINEDYVGQLVPHYHEGQPGAEDGNAYFYGVEIGYSGKHAMSKKQYATLMLLAGAIAEHHNWTEKSFIAHGEWSNWKWDPGISNGTMMNMVRVRGDIKQSIKYGPEGKPVADNGIDEPDVTNDVYEKVWHTDRATPPKGHATVDNPTWHQDSVLRLAAEQAEEANKKLDDLINQARINGAALSKIMAHLGIS